jgi:uridine kinase
VKKNNHFLIGIAGGSGSGKTTFLRAILDKFPSDQIALVSQDNYYEPRENQQADENGVINFDLPTSINREHFAHDMQRLMNGETLEKIEYTFNNKAAAPKTVYTHPAPIIIMEGLFVFHYEEIRNQLDYKVFIDAHHETRLERRIRRDSAERGHPEHEVRYQWDNHVRPAELKYLEPYKADCELVIDNTHNFDDGLNELLDMIQKVINA